MVDILNPRPVSSGPIRPNHLPTLVRGTLLEHREKSNFLLLARLHRVADSTLISMSLILLIIVCLTLHWQERWTIEFTNLERTRYLSRRLAASTTMLERYLLKHGRTPRPMIPVRAVNLIYLDRPSSVQIREALPVDMWLRSLLRHTVQAGY